MDDTHPFDLLRRKETKLNFLDRAQRRLGVWEENVRHDGRFLFFFFRVNQVVNPVGVKGQLTDPRGVREFRVARKTFPMATNKSIRNIQTSNRKATMRNNEKS